MEKPIILIGQVTRGGSAPPGPLPGTAAEWPRPGSHPKWNERGCGHGTGGHVTGAVGMAGEEKGRGERERRGKRGEEEMRERRKMEVCAQDLDVRHEMTRLGIENEERGRNFGSKPVGKQR
eukprot:765145-Hanusia_phi.AAC.4